MIMLMPILYVNIINSVIAVLPLLVMGTLELVVTQKVSEATMLNTDTTIVIDHAHPLPFSNP
jgi:hypothetical protein